MSESWREPSMGYGKSWGKAKTAFGLATVNYIPIDSWRICERFDRLHRGGS